MSISLFQFFLELLIDVPESEQLALNIFAALDFG
jgi:hypothetical protein